MADPEVCGLDIPPQADSPVTVEVTAREQEAISAVAIRGEGEGETKTELKIEKQEGENRYKIVFPPPEKDKYRLEIKRGENHINGSPLHLDLRAPNAKSVTIAEPPAGKLKAGQPIRICFDTSNAGRGIMQSTCTGEEVGGVDVDVKRRGVTNKFDVTFKPPHEDEYVVHVKWAERSIKGSPFKIDLIPVNPNKVKASAPKIPANPGDPIEMDISTKGAGNAKLTATCMGTLGGKISVSLKKVAPHDYHLTVKPPERDILSLSVQYGGKHIPNSPFQVNTLLVDASRVKVTEPENPETGNPVCYKLNTLEAGAGVLSATCEGEKSGPIDIEIAKEGSTKHKHVASFTPPVADVYTVGILWGNGESEPKHVPGSPFKVPLLIPPDASKVKPGDLHVPSKAGADEWVWLELDCSEAGHGELSAEARRQDSGDQVEVVIEKIEDDKYRLKFKADQAGKYNLAVLYSDSPIPNSPFQGNILPVDASRVKVTEPENPEIGNPVCYKLNTLEAGAGVLSATCEGEKSGPVDIEIAKEGSTKHKHVASFTPPVADVYTVGILWGDGESEPKHVPGSPFKVPLLIPPDASKVKPGDLHVPSKAGADEWVWLELDCSEAGQGELSAEARRQDSGDQVEVEIEKIEDDKYRLKFKADQAGKYNLAVLYSDSPIPNSPFQGNILPVDASRVKVTEPENPEIGNPVCYKLNTLEAGAGVLSATCEGEKSGPIDIEIAKEGSTKHKHVASFTPPVADVYTVGILWGDGESEPKHVPGSPFKVPLLIPSDASKVKPGDLHVPSKAGANEWVWLELDCSEAGHGELSAEARRQDSGDQVEVEINKIEDDKYRVKFKADQAGKYNLAVLYSDGPIPTSPYSNIEILDLSPKPELVRHIETKQPEVKGGQATLLFDAKDAGMGEFRARVAGLLTGQTAADYDLVPGSDHVYKVSFNPQLADTYLVDVYWEDHPVTDSPFYVEIIHPDEVIVTGPNEVKTESTRSFVFNVDTSNAGPGKLSATCEIKDKNTEVEAIVEEDEEEACKYTVTVCPEEEAVYSVSILFVEHHVTGSPFEIDLLPKLIQEGPCTQQKLEGNVEDWKLDLPEGSSPPAPEPEPAAPVELQMFIGDPFSFVIGKENVGHLSSMLASAYGEKTGTAVVQSKENEEGLPSFFFDPEVADKYTVEVKMSGEILAGNSYIINYIYPVDASKCVVFDTEGLEEDLLINEEVSFGVDATKAGDGRLTANVDGPNSCSESQASDVRVTSSDENPNIYRISYLPKTRGTHKINLQWAGEPIPDSPIVLKVGSSKDIPTFFRHQPFVIHFTTDCDPKDVESYAIHDDSCVRYFLKIGRRQQQEKLKLVLNAEEVGIHSIHVLIGGKEILGSPFDVLFIESDPTACKIIDFTEKPSVGVETSFKIDTKKAGQGDLHIKAKVPAGGRTDVNHIDHEDGLYSVVFMPKVAGAHRFQVLWAEEAIPDSPVTVEVSPEDPELLASQKAAAKVFIDKKDMPIFSKKLPISEAAVFGVCAKDAGTGRLNIRATGPCEMKIKVEDEEDGTYKCTLRPKVAGNYLIDILWNDFAIPSSPLELNFTKGKSYMINRLKLETDYFSIDKPREYVIDCGKEKGKFKVECHPSSAANIELTAMEGRENTYLCKIIPLVAGNHTVHVTYDDSHILDSPYIVQFYDEEHQEREKDGGGDEEEDVDRLSSLGSLQLELGGDETAQEIPDLQLLPKPDKVRAYGPGLSTGYVGQEGNFTIETGEGGNGKLEVTVSGVKSSFKLNMRHHPDSDRTVLARYDPRYAGEYTIDIKWADIPIPGSPFVVEIAEQNQIVYNFNI